MFKLEKITLQENTSSTSTPSQKELKESKETSNHDWLPLAQGSYNKVCVSNFPPTPLVANESYQGPWVLKYPIFSKYPDPIADAMNESKRGIRLWNEINSDLPKAGPYKTGWIAPYIQETRAATDEECVNKLLEIYRHTRRIVADAATSGNFLTEIKTGKVILVDVDLALKRRNSEASAGFFKSFNRRFAGYWVNERLMEKKPHTLEMIRNLIFLEANLAQDTIDLLCQKDQINFKNIQTLTWLRVNKRSLTPATFQAINIVTVSGTSVSETALDILSSEDVQTSLSLSSSS